MNSIIEEERPSLLSKQKKGLNQIIASAMIAPFEETNSLIEYIKAEENPVLKVRISPLTQAEKITKLKLELLK